MINLNKKFSHSICTKKRTKFEFREIEAFAKLSTIPMILLHFNVPILIIVLSHQIFKFQQIVHSSLEEWLLEKRDITAPQSSSRMLGVHETFCKLLFRDFKQMHIHGKR